MDHLRKLEGHLGVGEAVRHQGKRGEMSVYCVRKAGKAGGPWEEGAGMKICLLWSMTGELGFGDLPSADANPRTQGEGLACFFVVAAVLGVGVGPPLWCEEIRVVEVLGVVGDGPGTGVKLGLHKTVTMSLVLAI